MFYILCLVFLAVSLYAGYRMTLAVDKYLERHPEAGE